MINFVTEIKKWIREKWNKLKEKISVNQNKVSIPEYSKYLKQYNKNQLIDEIIITARNINKNKWIPEPEYRKGLRVYSKRVLIKTLVALKICEERSIVNFVGKVH